MAADLDGVRRQGHGYKAKCPAHEDHNPSLSIAQASDRILLKCHAGCATESIMMALGRSMSDLFAPNAPLAAPVQVAPALPPLCSRIVDSLHRRLNDDVRSDLREHRGLTSEVIDRYRLGVKRRYGDLYVSIPICDRVGSVTNIRLWLPPRYRRQNMPKIISWETGRGKAEWYPIDQLITPNLVVTEGEMDALALISAGVPAITVTGGASTWLDDFSKALAGKKVTLVMDNDEAGRVGAKKRSDGITNWAGECRVVKWPKDRPEGWDVTDELVKNGADSLKVILQAAEVAAVESAAGPNSKLIVAPKSTITDDVPDFPLDLPSSVWRGIVGDYRDMLQSTTEAPDSYHLFTFLTCCGSLFGRRVYIEYGRRLFVNLYVAIVGPTCSARKSTSLGHAEDVVRDADPSWTILRGLSTAEGLLAQIADPPRNQNNNGASTGLGGTTDKRLLVWLSELSSLLRKAKQERVSNIVPLLTEAFDCPRNLQLPTRADPITVTDPFVSLLCASTPAWLEADLSNRDILGGFANRFLYVLGEPKNPIPFPDPPDVNLRTGIVNQLSKVNEGLPADGMEVHLTANAKEIWHGFYVRWRSLRWGDEIQDAVLQRIPDMTLKIALIYAALEKQSEINAEILSAAIDATGYGAASAQRIFGDFNKSKRRKLEDRVVQVLGDRGPMRRSVLHQAVSGRHSAAEVTRMLEDLVRAEMVVQNQKEEYDLNKD